MVRESHPPQLNIIFRGNANLSMNFQPGVVLAKLGAGLRKNGFAAFGDGAAWLMRGRPELAGGYIAHVDKGSPAITCSILPPAGDREVTPAAVTAARVADHDVITAVG